jgi:hypothetical protein
MAIYQVTPVTVRIRSLPCRDPDIMTKAREPRGHSGFLGPPDGGRRSVMIGEHILYVCNIPKPKALT